MTVGSLASYLRKHRLKNTLYNRIRYTLEKVNGTPASTDEVNTIFDELFTSYDQYIGVGAIEIYIKQKNTTRKTQKGEGNIWLMYRNKGNY